MWVKAARVPHKSLRDGDPRADPVAAAIGQQGAGRTRTKVCSMSLMLSDVGDLVGKE